MQSLGLDKGTENSLLVKLNAAKSSLEKGNTAAAEGQLNAFINEVNAQRGKKIPTEAADDLIADAMGPTPRPKPVRKWPTVSVTALK